MYPKNAASPPRIAIGAVVQISDGAVQTSGVSVVVRPEGGAESAGGGTIAYSAASGVVYYTPTQAETNYTAFCVIAYKMACIPAQVTVVTTASDTAGTVELDADSLRSALGMSASDLDDQLDAILAASGGGGGGDATLAKQEEILEAIDELSAVQLAVVGVDAGTISGFPETLTIGDSYSEDTGQIKIDIEDSVSGDPIDSLGTLEFADADVTFTAFRPNDSARIVGSCEYVREPSSGTLTASYVLVTLLTSETVKGKAEYTYEGRLKFVWQGPSSSDETDEEQKTYKTLPFKFIANP